MPNKTLKAGTFWLPFRFVHAFGILHKTPIQPKCPLAWRYMLQGWQTMIQFFLGIILLVIGMYGLYTGFNAYLNSAILLASTLLIITGFRKKAASQKISNMDASVTTQSGLEGGDSGCSNAVGADFSDC